MAETIEKKQVCKCEKCGSEAEMVVTCSLEDVEAAKKDEVPLESDKVKKHGDSHQVKGSATCATCGNEADMWIDV